ncbi:MAG: hypothetical protein R2780_07035 [Crocinitomicaceae bacterium]|nr:hypothetical protein [Crocinitomicaceae bacterium]
MAVTLLPWWLVLIWAVFATVFYMIRYRHVKTLKNPWIIAGIFAANLFFFAYAVIIFLVLEYIRSKRKEKD